MGTRDPRIDAYIAKSPDFAKPILEHLRETVHQTCPTVEETMKWSVPHFMYNGMLCAMSSFKEHAAFGFWKGSLVLAEDSGRSLEAAGSFGRLTSVEDLPPKRALQGYIRKAMALNDDGVKVERPKHAPKPPPEAPDYLLAALRKNRKAMTTFDGFSPSRQREYVEWIVEAKTDATREKRLAQALEWMAEGKARNWKYEKC